MKIFKEIIRMQNLIAPDLKCVVSILSYCSQINKLHIVSGQVVLSSQF